MATKRRIEFVYGLGDNLIQLPPAPIDAQRDPTVFDQGQIGQLWVNRLTNTVWALTSIVAGSSTWTSTPAAGATIVSSLQVTGAGGIDVDTGDVDITLGDLNIPTGNATIAGDLSVAGTTSFTGDLDVNSPALIDFTSTLDAAPSIYLHANGGTSEQIRLHADQGTAVNAIELDADDGGITLVSGLASADAINLSATGGGIDIDAALQINVASSQSAADAIVLEASAGGLDILASGAAPGEDIDITATGSSVNITSTEAVADAVVINASNALGGIDVLTGGGEISLSSAGNVSIAPATQTEASPTATATINARVFKATFTGFTTASSDTQAFTITNSAHTAGAGVFITVANAGTNDAQMTLTRVNVETAGTIIVETINNGAAALNGNVIITGFIID